VSGDAGGYDAIVDDGHGVRFDLLLDVLAFVTVEGASLEFLLFWHWM
jgi:hypothetical protein